MGAHPGNPVPDWLFRRHSALHSSHGCSVSPWAQVRASCNGLTQWEHPRLSRARAPTRASTTTLAAEPLQPLCRFCPMRTRERFGAAPLSPRRISNSLPPHACAGRLPQPGRGLWRRGPLQRLLPERGELWQSRLLLWSQQLGFRCRSSRKSCERTDAGLCMAPKGRYRSGAAGAAKRNCGELRGWLVACEGLGVAVRIGFLLSLEAAGRAFLLVVSKDYEQGSFPVAAVRFRGLGVWRSPLQLAS